MVVLYFCLGDTVQEAEMRLLVPSDAWNSTLEEQKILGRNDQDSIISFRVDFNNLKIATRYE